MKIGQKFNQLTFNEYVFYIDNYKKYTDFNTLGLYRSIVENDNLSLKDKINIREYAHKNFKKTFDFLQLKDPKTYIEVKYIGQELTKGDENQIWDDIRKAQNQILSDKRIKHRNFGDYSKHNCGEESCIYNGIMIRQGSWLTENSIHPLNHRWSEKTKSKRLKSERKNLKNIIDRELQNE